MTPNEILNRYWLGRIITWRHELELLDAETVAILIKNLKASNNLLRQKIAEELPAVWAEYTAEEGGAAVRLWLGELLTDPAMQIEDTITEAWSLSGQSSLAAYNDILSVNGLAKNIITVPITMEAIRGLASKKLFAGYSLGQLVAKAFTEGQIASVIETLDNGIKQGLSYPKVIKALNETALNSGAEITQRESITLARSYIQQASVNAQLAVFEKNKKILKGVKWCSILDNKICELCAATDGLEYSWDEERPPMPRHPRCFLPQTRVYAPDVIAAFKTEYKGPAFHFKLANNSEFYVTANHPLLTDKGFLPAYQIDADTLIYCNDTLQGYAQKIEQIYNKIYQFQGASEQIVMSQASLHGDGIYSGEYVELAMRNNIPDWPKFFSSKYDERFLLYEELNCGNHNISVYEASIAKAGWINYLLQKRSNVSLQPVIKIDRIFYDGLVYDLQTLSSLYYADSAIVSNCRCLWLPWVKSWRDIGIDADELEKAARPWLIREEGNIDEGGNRKILFAGTSKEDFPGWWETLPYDQQIKSIGPVRTNLIRSGKLSWADLMNKNTGEFYTLKQLGFSESGKPL